MASNLNRVTLSGNLTRDPELTYTPGGTAVLRLGLASNEGRKGADGQWEEHPNFVDCVLFGKRAEGLSPHLSKGDLVCLVGRLRYSSWEKDGARRSKLEVVVDDVQLCGARPHGGATAPVAEAVAPQDAYGAVWDAGKAGGCDDVYGDELPF